MVLFSGVVMPRGSKIKGKWPDVFNFVCWYREFICICVPDKSKYLRYFFFNLTVLTCALIDSLLLYCVLCWHSLVIMLFEHLLYQTLSLSLLPIGFIPIFSKFRISSILGSNNAVSLFVLIRWISDGR